MRTKETFADGSGVSVELDGLSDRSGSTRVPDTPPRFSDSPPWGGSSGPRSRSSVGFAPNPPSRRSPSAPDQHAQFASTAPQFYTGGFAERRAGLQELHDANANQPPLGPFNVVEPRLRSSSANAAPKSQASKNVVERVGVFEGASKKVIGKKEADGEQLAEETGIRAVWRPKADLDYLLADTTLRHQRGSTVCARVEPDSRCFCGFTFVEHPAEARLGGSAGDGFAWKRSLGKKRGERGAGPGYTMIDTPCSRFRYMPCSPAQTSAQVACQDAFRAARGADAASLHRGWFAKCRNCDHGHQDHDPETETCPLAYDEQVGNGRYASAWECVVCNRRWEDHETAFESAIEVEARDREEAVRGGAGGPRAVARATAQRRSQSSQSAQGPVSQDTGIFSQRAAEVEQILRENTYGLSGKHSDSEHYQYFDSYGDTQQFRHQIQLENALLRERAEQAKRLHGRGDNTMTFVDTTTAYKQGKGSLYGHGVGDERERYDNFGRELPMSVAPPGAGFPADPSNFITRAPPAPPPGWVAPPAAAMRSRSLERNSRSTAPSGPRVRFSSADDVAWRDTLRRGVQMR